MAEAIAAGATDPADTRPNLGARYLEHLGVGGWSVDGFVRESNHEFGEPSEQEELEGNVGCSKHSAASKLRLTVTRLPSDDVT